MSAKTGIVLKPSVNVHHVDDDDVDVADELDEECDVDNYDRCDENDVGDMFWHR